MRVLSPALVAAQRGRVARPWVRLTVDDRHVGVARLRPRPVYQGAEGDGACALACCDGYVLRAWLDAAGDLRLCRTQAGAGSGWDGWALLASGVDTRAQVALAAGDGKAYLFYVGGDGRTLLCRRSADGGVSWAAAEAVHQVDTGYRIASLAAVRGAAHDCICLFADDGQGAEPDDLVHLAWLQQGQWLVMDWPRDAGDGVAGLAAVSYGGDSGYSGVHFALCGAFEGSARPAVRLYYLQLTSEGLPLWVHRGVVLMGEAPEFTWAWPALVAGGGERPRLFLVQRTPEGSRPGHLFLLRLGLVGPVGAGDFVPLDLAAPEGVGAAACAQELYFGNAARVQAAPLYDGGPDRRWEVSADVVRYLRRSRHRGSGAAGSDLWLLLDDGDGRYGPGGEAEGALRLDGQVCLREGYLTAAGAEVIVQAPYWVGEVERLPERRQVALRCYDGWGKLWRSYSDRAYEWRSSPALVLQEVLERFGFVYGDDGSPDLYCAGAPPRFSLAVGRSWGGLVARLLDYSGCELLFFTNPEEEETWPSVRVLVFTPSEEVCYDYGPGAHPLLAAGSGERQTAGAWVQFFGEGVYGEYLDMTTIAETGIAGVVQVVDRRLNEDTDVTAARAALLTRQRQRRAGQPGYALARPNVGQELLDLVRVEVARETLTRRVLGIERRYDRLRGVYEQRLLLGGG